VQSEKMVLFIDSIGPLTISVCLLKGSFNCQNSAGRQLEVLQLSAHCVVFLDEALHNGINNLVHSINCHVEFFAHLQHIISQHEVIKIFQS